MALADPTQGSGPRKAHRKVSTTPLVCAAIVVAALAVAATAYVLRDKIYDPSNSYGTDSPHTAAPAQQLPARR